MLRFPFTYTTSGLICEVLASAALSWKGARESNGLLNKGLLMLSREGTPSETQNKHNPLAASGGGERNNQDPELVPN
jgi:hypothetical protein